MVDRIEISDDTLESYKEDTTASSAPRISIIIPVYDDPEGIEATLQSVLTTSYPNVEVLPVMTPADGETRAVIDEFVETDDRVSVYLEDDNHTPGAARNVGLEHAEGDLVVFIDADMTVRAPLPWKVAYAFEETTVDYMGFPVEILPADDENIFGWYDRMVRFPNEAIMDNIGFCPTCALAIRMDIYEDGLEFNPRLTSAEDYIFGNWVSREGYELGFCPDIYADHPARNSFGALYKKAKKTGTGWHQVYKQEPDEDLFTRSPLILHVSLLPEPPSLMQRFVADWETLQMHEKAIMYTISHAENLIKTWGYTAEAIAN